MPVLPLAHNPRKPHRGNRTTYVALPRTRTVGGGVASVRRRGSPIRYTSRLPLPHGVPLMGLGSQAQNEPGKAIARSKRRDSAVEKSPVTTGITGLFGRAPGGV